MLKPINGHVLIEPITHDSFIATQKETYEEIGIVVDLDVAITAAALGYPIAPKKGDKVYFDSWLCSKFPKEDGSFFWLVPFDAIKAYESLPE